MKADPSELNKLSVDFIDFNTKMLLEHGICNPNLASKFQYTPLISLPMKHSEQLKNIMISVLLAEQAIASIMHLHRNALSFAGDPDHLLDSIDVQFINKNLENTIDLNIVSDWHYYVDEQSFSLSTILVNNMVWTGLGSLANKSVFEYIQTFQVNENHISYTIEQSFIKDMHSMNLSIDSYQPTPSINLSVGNQDVVSSDLPHDIEGKPSIKPVEPNHAPIVTPIEHQTFNEDAVLNYNASKHFQDNDLADHLIYKAQQANGSELPDWLQINEKTGVITGCPTNNHVGSIIIKVIAVDSHGLSVSTTMEITVSNINDAPIVTPIADISINEDAVLHYDVSSSFSDMDAGDSLAYSLDSGAPSWLQIDLHTGVLSGTPGNGDVGIASITVIATDQSSATTQSTFQITVDNINDAPTVTPIADTSVNEDAVLHYDVSSSFSDMDAGDSLAYSLDSGAPSWLQIDLHTGVLSGTPGNGDVGIASITVIATDQSGATTQSTFQITVDNINDAPIVTQIDNFILNDSQDFKIDLSVYFSDEDVGDVLSYFLSKDSPDWVYIDESSGVIYGSPPQGFSGTLPVTIICRDSSGDSVENTFKLEVLNNNHAPVASSIEYMKIAEDSSLKVNLSQYFSDQDSGDVLTYSLSADTPVWLKIDSGSGTIYGTPENNDVGTTHVTVIATDSHGESVSNQFEIYVANTNDVPTVTPIADTSLNRGVTLNYSIGGYFSDIDVGDGLTYSLAKGAPAWLSINASTGVISGTPTSGDAGIANVTVIATDYSGSTAEDTFQITVNDINDAPTVKQISKYVQEENMAVNYNVSSYFSDLNGDALTYSAAKSGGGALPSWFSINSKTGVISGTPGSSDSSTNSIIITATDSHGVSVSNTFILQILDVLTGTSGNNTMKGNSTSQVFYTLGGIDTVYGDASRDVSGGTMGSDIIHGGDGSGATGNTLYGDVGGRLNDTSIGGNDTIYGGAANDKIYGDAGDRIKDTAVGGNDTIHGGGGNDTIYGDVGNELRDSGRGGDDIIYGDAGNDNIYGDSGGSDNGKGGNDWIDGGSGSDTIRGGSGNDTIVYDSTDVLIDGQSGSDTLLVNSDGFVSFKNVSHMENINMDNGLSNTVSITASDVLNIGADKNTIIFNGDSLDVLNLNSGHWVQNDAAAPLPAGAHAGDYHTYVSNDNGAIVQVEAIVQVIVHDPA